MTWRVNLGVFGLFVSQVRGVQSTVQVCLLVKFTALPVGFQDRVLSWEAC